MSAEKILANWKSKQFKPVYWLEGEEDYYIDKVMNYAEHSILSESEASFNLSVFYGKDANWSDVVNACMRYPMFAEKQVVLLKEAQHMKDLDMLENYILNPLASTIFIISHKEKTISKVLKLGKLIKKNAEIFLSEKVKDYNLIAWITDYVKLQEFSMSQKSVVLLADHLGCDLNRIVNEIEKMTLNIGERKTITEEDIEKFVGVSKEYNAFELSAALAKKDLSKAIRIIQYFESNPKAVPIQLVLPALYSFFSKLYIIFGMADKSENALKPLFYNNSYATRDALATAKMYGYDGIERALLLLHEYNLKSIGINANGISDGSLLKEMVVKIIE